MAIDLQAVRDLRASYSDQYEEMHVTFRNLRDVWHSRFWSLAERESQDRSITSIFRDLGRANRASLPPIRIVRPIIWQICVKYQTFLSPVPQVNYYMDAPESQERRHEMTTKERYTLGVWRAGMMAKRFREIAWYQPLMGDTFIGCYPDPARKIPVPILRDPEHAYPLKGFGGEVDSGHIFAWKERESTLRRAFKDYVPQADTALGKRGYLPSLGSRRGRETDPQIEVIEYSDEQEFARWAGTKKVAGVEHNFGFDIFEHAKFIEIPGETWGCGAVEQIVNLNEADNMIYSLLFQAVLENVFPTIVLTDPAKAPEELMKGPGSVIPLNPGGKFDIIAPPVAALPAQLGYLAQNKSSMMEAAGVSPADFGTSPASSIVTGAAINELQAGTGSTVEMVQSSLGFAMSRWNEKAVHIQRKLWPDHEITLNYMSPLTVADLRPSQGVVTVKGSELKGGTANEIVFNPAMNMHDKLVMWLQAKGGGLVSDQHILKQLGIPDPEAMQEEIFGEELTRAVLANLVQTLSSPDAQGVKESETQAFAFIEGTGVPGVTKPGLPRGQGGGMLPSLGQGGPPGGSAQSPGGPPNAGPQLGGQGLAQAKPLQLPPGAPVPATSEAAQSMPPGGGQNPLDQLAPKQPATLNTVVRALSQGTYAGRVWLVGEIVARGQTAGQVEVAVTDPADRQTVSGTAPQFDYIFHVVQGEPREQAVEVTSGQVSDASA